MRLVQHKREAYWFYRFLSIFYDKLVNPLFWTKKMRDDAHELADFHRRDLLTIDVGSGTGFNTEGIVRHIDPEYITCVDQSPHQMAKAKEKEVLQGCRFVLGDAEQLPFPTDHFDRYVSAGSIEYWPNPQQGINESYRVIKPGGRALMIGPLEPQGWFTRLMATIWMLFPKDEEYRRWYKEAGFTNIEVRYIAPHWVTSEPYGIAIVGEKPKPGVSPNHEEVAARLVEHEPEKMSLGRSLLLLGRVLIGSLAGFIFIPMALLGYLFSVGSQRDLPSEYRSRLNGYQIAVLVLIFALLIAFIAWII